MIVRRDEVVGPVPADGVTHYLAEDGLVAPRSDVPSPREHGETEEHGSEDPAQEEARSSSPSPLAAA